VTTTEQPDRTEGQEVLSQQDQVNRITWSRHRVLDDFDDDTVADLEGWSDPGERAAFLSIAPRLRNQPVLDVGVGGGRTTSIVRLMTDDYLAVDYTPEMVALCRKSHPDADVRLADVRDLSELASDHFGAVVFSFGGLDAIDHDGRRTGLAELHRVLRPGGLLLFSTHNKDGPAYGATPWHQAGPIQRQAWSLPYRLARFAGNLLLHPGHLPRSFRNWSRLRHLGVDAVGWGISPVEAHDFDLLVHFVELEYQAAELHRLGFDVVDVFDAERGRRLTVTDRSPTRYFHIVARKC
jgi:SAM-dependent methyltransferase